MLLLVDAMDDVHPLLNGHSSSNLVVCFFVPCSDVFEFGFLLFAVHLDRVRIMTLYIIKVSLLFLDFALF